MKKLRENQKIILVQKISVVSVQDSDNNRPYFDHLVAILTKAVYKSLFLSPFAF